VSGELHTALSVGVEEDLLPLSVLLHRQGVAHRIVEENGRQVLKVQQPSRAPEVAALYRAWRAGELSIELRGSPAAVPLLQGVDWRRAPVTLVLIALSFAGFALVWLGAPPGWLAELTFQPFTIEQGRLVLGNAPGEYWRYITPVFLHFGWLHIVFNCLWLWELGSKVEAVMGHLNTILLFLVIALVSNVGQAAYGGEGLFGGMSGVVYGLLGFAWVGSTLQPAWRIRPARPVLVFMLGWLVVCLLGLVQVMGFGAVANAAHVGGLASGAILGALFGLSARAGGGEPG